MEMSLEAAGGVGMNNSSARNNNYNNGVSQGSGMGNGQRNNQNEGTGNNGSR